MSLASIVRSADGSGSFAAPTATICGPAIRIHPPASSRSVASNVAIDAALRRRIVSMRPSS
jgi:hypothetical protein